MKRSSEEGVMKNERLTRRDFLKAAGMAAATVAVGGIPSPLFGEERRLAKFPEKTEFRIPAS